MPTIILTERHFMTAVRRLERLRRDAEKAGDLGLVLRILRELNRLRCVVPERPREGDTCPRCELVCGHLAPVLEALGMGSTPDAAECARLAAARLRDLIVAP